MDQGHRVHLANTAAIQQYEGLLDRGSVGQMNTMSLGHPAQFTGPFAL